MGKKTKKRLVTLFIIVFATVIAINFYGLYKKCIMFDDRITKLEYEIHEEKEKQVDLINKKEYYQSKAYIEEVARKKLHLIKPNEKLYVIK